MSSREHSRGDEPFPFTIRSWQGSKADERADHEQRDKSYGDGKLGAGTKAVLPLLYEATAALF